jgi:hypothetical protein
VFLRGDGRGQVCPRSRVARSVMARRKRAKPEQHLAISFEAKPPTLDELKAWAEKVRSGA